MPLQRRIPKFGFKNRSRVEYRPINLARVAELIEQGTFSAEKVITPQAMVKAGLARKSDRIKILGAGEITQAVFVRAHAFSGSAREKIEAAGGSAIVIEKR